jgi:broad specificity phosphatase PhoE
MSTLLLIRHGQASFGAEDYDVLSERGAVQARVLGRHLATGGGEPIHALYTGPRRRQIDTARHMAEAAAAAGLELPAPAVVDELDEFPAIEILRMWLPRLAAEDPDLAAALTSSDRAVQGGAIDRTFELVSRQWARGELDTGHLESFAAFSERVGRGLERIMEAEGRGRRALVVTSGGPISVAVRACLGTAEEATLRLALVLANASTTEIRWRESELTLFGFNHVHYLDREHVTYR